LEQFRSFINMMPPNSPIFRLAIRLPTIYSRINPRNPTQSVIFRAVPSLTSSSSSHNCQTRRWAHTVLQDKGAVPIKLWTQGLPQLERQAENQLRKTAQLKDVIHPRGMAVMPDCHWGIGATVGSVIPTTTAIIPAAVGVDIGCGMIAVQTDLTSSDLPDNLRPIRNAIEKAIPHGRSGSGNASMDIGAWSKGTPDFVMKRFRDELADEFSIIKTAHPRIGRGNLDNHLGTLGTGNHFIEVCLDERQVVWFVLHSGSRGVGNRIGTYFIELAKNDMRRHLSSLPDADLAYFRQGSDHFEDYVRSMTWAQKFARINREVMMALMIAAVRASKAFAKPFKTHVTAVNCHHNFTNREVHFNEEMLITRKGAVRADKGMLGIIPGSMGASTFIVRGKGNPDSYNTCSHGAGRLMSRAEAKRRFTVQDHIKATSRVECRKDKAVIDETPAAYKPIEKVMAAQQDLVDVVHTLRQIVCVKG